MKVHFSLSGLFLLILLTVAPLTGNSSMLYGFNIPEEVLSQKVGAKLAGEDAVHPLLIKKDIIPMERPHQMNDRSSDFFLILTLIVFVGVFRLANPAYFRNLFRAFRNPSLSTRQLKEQLRQDSAASLILDLVFCLSMGVYIYFVLHHIHQKDIAPNLSSLLAIFGFAVLFVSIYVVRFLFLKFTGWVFNISEITDNYTFNVFLINKIMGIAIIPFSIILAFGQGPWVQATLLISFVAIGILFINRYLRSGVVFGYFLKFSKLHFFMYLCASELLPLAVLMKMVNQWLIA